MLDNAFSFTIEIPLDRLEIHLRIRQFLSFYVSPSFALLSAANFFIRTTYQELFSLFLVYSSWLIDLVTQINCVLSFAQCLTHLESFAVIFNRLLSAYTSSANSVNSVR